MRILQLIDSLEAGGAEMMAVNYANTIATKTGFSALVATRKEGSLKKKIEDKVYYLFLERKSVIDVRAVLKLKEFCKTNQINFIHAHSSSYAIACMVKLIYPRIKIVWHDHDGMSEFLHKRKTGILKIASLFFSGIIAVNDLLKKWDESRLHCSKVIYLPNFSIPQQYSGEFTILHGSEGKRILCLANLREQKNHMMIVEVALKFRTSFPDWTFHLVGKDFKDSYSEELRRSIEIHKLSDYIYMYGSKSDIGNIMSQSEIGILTSLSEGLPISLLEYGFHQKAVVATAVGEVPSIIENGVSGYTVKSGDVSGFSDSLIMLVRDRNLRNKFGHHLYRFVEEHHSDKAVADTYLNWLKSISNG